MIHYFDNAATTRVDDDLIELIAKYNTEKYFNPSSLHRYALDVASDVHSARKDIADCLNCNVDELYFTSCGSESDNTAIFGAMPSKTSLNVVSTAVEHSAVYSSMMQLKNRGYDVRFCKVNQYGQVDAQSLSELVDANTRLVSIMHVNNETGAINDIEMLVKAVKTKNPNTLFMSDGVQAVGKIKVNLRQLGVDFYTFSGHKIHAPKGVGGLFVKKGIHLNPLIYGGGQENGLRSGTENVASIEALSLAVKRSTQRIEQNTAQYLNFKDIILSECQTQLGSCVKQISPSDPDQCSPNILTLSFSGVKSQVLLNILEQSGYIIGLGSACNSHNKTNRVMSNIGLDRDYVDGVVRICFSKYNSQEEVSDFARIMCENVKMLREL